MPKICAWEFLKILKGNKKWLFDWLKEFNTKGRLIYKLILTNKKMSGYIFPLFLLNHHQGNIIRVMLAL